MDHDKHRSLKGSVLSAARAFRSAYGSRTQWQHECSAERRTLFEAVKALDEFEATIDPYETEEYATFVASMAKTCHANNPPCDGCLAGGMCDGPDDEYCGMPYDDWEEDTDWNRKA